MKKIVKALLLICWMGVIFFFSSQVKNDSIVSTNIVVDIFYKLVRMFMNVDYNEFINVVFKPVRKIAHFSEFAILGLLIYINIIEYRKSNVLLLSIICSVIYATSDEVHQLFVSGRSFWIFDILIDSTGAIFGIVIAHLIMNRWKRKN